MLLLLTRRHNQNFLEIAMTKSLTWLGSSRDSRSGVKIVCLIEDKYTPLQSF